MNQAIVAILLGSKSDIDLIMPATQVLDQLDIDHEVRIMSAHRTPEHTVEYARNARRRGLRVLICAAGGAAHLAGLVAAHTSLPVIGVPLARTSLAGQDALLSTVQMPDGLPVATVAIDNSYNAAILAAQMLALSNERIRAAVDVLRMTMTERVTNDDLALQRAYADARR